MIVFDLVLEKSLFGAAAKALFKAFASKSNKCFKGNSVLMLFLEVLFLVDNFHNELAFWENETLHITIRAVVNNRFMLLIISRLNFPKYTSISHFVDKINKITDEIHKIL
jgi:hypothetical protein